MNTNTCVVAAEYSATTAFWLYCQCTDVNTMQSLKNSPDLGEKLVVILKRLGDPSLKVTDDVLLEKLLGAVRSEFCKL